MITSKEALENVKIAPSFMGGNPKYLTCLQSSIPFLEDINIIKKDLEVLEELEILRNYYPPFKDFLKEMFKNGYNEDLTKIKEWLDNE